MSHKDELPVIDGEVRAALLRLADRAPDAARVRSRLNRVARRHRQRRAILLAGGVAVGAGVVGGGALAANRLLAGSYGLPPDGRTPANLPPAASPPPPGSGNSAVPLRYRPTWLPAGFVEQLRSTTVDSRPGQLRQRREWYPQHADRRVAGPHIYLDLVPDAWWGIADWRTPVRINGARGGLGPSGSTPTVLWEAGGGLNLGVSVSGFEDNRKTALQIARSVTPDGRSVVEIGLEFGWWPQGSNEFQEFTLDPTGSDLGVVVDREQRVSVSIDRTVDLSAYGEGEQTTIRGVPATRWVVSPRQPATDSAPGAPVAAGSDGMTMVTLTLPDGRPLFVTVDGSVIAGAEVTRLIESLRIGPRPDTTWLGSR